MAQFTSLALYNRREVILRLLMEATNAAGAMVRIERGIAQKEGLVIGEETTIGSLPEGPVEIKENGLSYRVDIRLGQKTGFYLDQRLNRLAAAQYCRGRQVLDLFCFTGGFSLNALRGGALECARDRQLRRRPSSWPASTRRSMGSMQRSSKKATCLTCSRG